MQFKAHCFNYFVEAELNFRERYILKSINSINVFM